RPRADIVLLLKRGQTVIWAALLSALLPTAARCQTLPSGVVNAPPTVIGAGESIGSDTTLNVFDNGVVGVNFSAGLNDGSSTNVLVNISGGTIGDGFTANGGSVINVSGGDFGGLSVQSGATVNILEGGFINASIDAGAGSTLNLSGGFLDVASLFSGNGFGLAPDVELNVSSGEIGNQTNPQEFHIAASSVVRVSNGRLGSNFSIEEGGALILSGGQFDTGSQVVFNALSGSTVDILGGGIPESGDGTFFEGIPVGFNSFGAANDSIVNFVGRGFSVGGVPLDLAAGETIEITDRQVALSGVLTDGSGFTVGLYTENGLSTSGRVEAGALITVTRVVPEPGAGLLAAFAIASSSVRRRQH
ncbi:MAG: hypothetical protein AAF596_00415, partial [Planctomycetota bacterium]